MIAACPTERSGPSTNTFSDEDAQYRAAAVTASHSRWLPPGPIPPEVQVAGMALGLPLPVAATIWSQGHRTVEQARDYLCPTEAKLHDPYLLNGMQAAVDRILLAIREREPVLIYGDYDVDGTLATVLLKTAIDRLTPKEAPSLVRYHIPHRIREGYGVQGAVLADAASTGIRLVISVDTGIRAFAAADEAQRLGLDLIVTDHHLPEESGIPAALAVINPNQTGCAYPFKDLCGAAVAYKLAEALLQAGSQTPGLQLRFIDNEGLGKILPSLLKLVAIATVADAVPLRGENRTIVAIGLRELKDVRQPGLRALMRLAEAGGQGKAPTATEIGFRIGPHMNAAGRMDIASDVVQLLLTRDLEEGEAIARKLHELNEERRAVERSVLLAIESEFLDKMAALDAPCRPDCLVIDGEGWHRGVIGILASRVVERTNLPALVITHADEVAHGSGRSIAGFHLLDAISGAHARHQAHAGAGLFERFGGHAHAVGFSLPSTHVPALRRYLSEHAANELDPSLLEKTLHIAAEITLADVTFATLQACKRMEPFGNGNPEPVFLVSSVRVAEVRIIKERHVKLCLEQAGSPPVTCMGWARGFAWPQRLEEMGVQAGSIVDVAAQLRENMHPDFGGPELQLCDLRVWQ